MELNLNTSAFNGGLFPERRAEAHLRAQAAAQEVKDLEIRIGRDVKVAWLNASNAFRRLDVTSRLVAQARRSMRLARARYDLGLSSIVELNQAQLNQTSAEITNASAKCEYQMERAAPDYASGVSK